MQTIEQHYKSRALEFVRSIINAMPPNVCVLLKDHQQGWILANDAAAKTCGFKDSHDAEGKHDLDTWATPLQIKQFKQSDDRVLAGEDQIHIIEKQDRDDGLHWLDGNKRLVEFEGRQYLLACWIDITDLVDARNDADRRRQLMSLVLDIFAHDTGSALRGIKGMAYLVQESLSDAGLSIPAEVGEYLNRIDCCCDRLQRLNAAVSQTRQLEGQKLERLWASQVISTVAQDILGLQYPSVEVNYLLSQDFEFLGNLDSITTHVFGNLIENAIKYGGRNTVITIAARRENGSGIFYTTNTGSHIAEKYRERVFLLGQRSRLQPHIAGTGTGLFYAQYTIDSFDGQIWVEPSATDRCRFAIRVPRLER